MSQVSEHHGLGQRGVQGEVSEGTGPSLGRCTSDEAAGVDEHRLDLLVGAEVALDGLLQIGATQAPNLLGEGQTLGLPVLDGGTHCTMNAASPACQMQNFAVRWALETRITRSFM